VRLLGRVLPWRRAYLFLLVTGVAVSTWAQQSAELPDLPSPVTESVPQGADPVAGSIHGIVVNGDGAVYEGAAVSLSQSGPGGEKDKATTSDSNGQFTFADVAPGAFKLTVSATGFASQVVTGTLHPGESFEAKAIVLSMSGTTSEIEVTATPAEIAQEELKQEETQRVLGVVPNFYVTYVPNAPPLTVKQKYQLAWRTSYDPVTFMAVGVIAGIEQATNTFSGYGQGMEAYGKRYGAGYGDTFIGTMIGGAILPAWWKQDPRYFYKGTGSTRSRVLYALEYSVMCKGDNGRREVNYSGIVGGLAAGGISNLYYPASDREGLELTFENALLGTAGSAVQNLFQEFVVRKLTPHVPNYGSGKP
jgi:Carboxypeptidase regulatory-like domain